MLVVLWLWSSEESEILLRERESLRDLRREEELELEARERIRGKVRGNKEKRYPERFRKREFR